ncbi:hypothetical protein HZC07_01985 [Candidatus Micrarchaeota archaeon]|nr:hypothetical protein [Candidatus Micrarchaeota archaeon]
MNEKKEKIEIYVDDSLRRKIQNLRVLDLDFNMSAAARFGMENLFTKFLKENREKGIQIFLRKLFEKLEHPNLQAKLRFIFDNAEEFCTTLHLKYGFKANPSELKRRARYIVRELQDSTKGLTENSEADGSIYSVLAAQIEKKEVIE